MTKPMRDQYLKNEWIKYPSAPENCQSLHQFLLKKNQAKNPTGWVGGRLIWQDPKQFEGGQFLLSAGDKIAECEWQLPFLLLGQKSGEAKAMSQESLNEFFRYGDQVAVFVESETSDEKAQHNDSSVKLRVSEVVLLAPAIKEPKIESFYTIKKWQNFLSHVREFFHQEGLQELTTSTLVECPGLEPSLEPFQTTWKMGLKSQLLFLPTSPEIQIKKKICQGAVDAFEIKTCFRNEEKSNHHLPEFHMLEWYRGYSRLDVVEKDVENLINFLYEKSNLAQSEGTVLEKTQIKIQRKSIADLMQKYLDFELTPQTGREQLKKLAKDKNIEVNDKDSWNDVFHRLWVECVEPHLANEGPLITHSYPPSQAALARTGSDGWIERFEFYWNGYELANAFHEVNDPHLQQQRWQQEIDERKHLGTTQLKGDNELLALQHTGMPPTSGIALGLERLFMAIHKVDDIHKIWL